MGQPVVHVVGARPNFMKAAPVMRDLERRGVRQLLVHTGQHYDERLSDVFFRELGLPEPDLNLGVGSGSHAQQTAALLVELERALLSLQPALVVVYGDVNSTLAAALVCAKLAISVAHVEAGLRSFDLTMPEEINRRVTDSLAQLLFATSPEALGYLEREGIDPAGVHFVGNPMIDTLLANLERFREPDQAGGLAVEGKRYAVATLHRPGNVDSPDSASRLATALVELSELLPVFVPLHPRGRKTLEAAGLSNGSRLRVIEPLGYLDFMGLVRGAQLVVTDSGGIQEETTILGVPCLTVRPNTERPITISHGTNRLVTPEEVVPRAREVLAGGPQAPRDPPPLWDGRAGERIGAIIERWVGGRPG